MSFKRPKGTRDFLPEDMVKRRWLFDVGRPVFERYGYGEIETPAFETLELLTCKDSLGEDAVKDIYRFKDKAGRNLGLRFDPTTPIARVIATDRSIKLPVKWCYNFVRMWRYEDVAKGRYREFYQAGVEIIGAEGPEADAEILMVVVDYMLATGLKQFTLRINSRKILDALAKKIGINNSIDIFRILDKLDKQGEKQVKIELSEFLNDRQIKEIFSFVRMKPEQARKYLNMSSLDVEDVVAALPAKYKKYVKIDFSIARGLDYYTGFIFETLIKGQESLGSVASGGRYDNLIEKYGGQPTPATGVGIGVERILEILETKKMFPKDLQPGPKVFIVPINDKAKKEAFRLTQELRSAGISADTDLTGKKFKKNLEYADSQKIPYAIIIGEKEIKQKKYLLKDMAKRKESRLSLSGIINKLK
ncbi:MAG: histidine--tRNA ligase [Nanoarchaeota archaeon]|nr:histidine--tRNA ligase [Nanoarchaeota archaeon]